MTQSKREPFAVISYCIEADENALSVGNQTVAGDGKHGFDHVALVDICKRINAAFNARVDEEVRKAVEKFRERAEIVVRQECGGKCGGDRGCEISRKIMEIPTEPEVK